MPKASHIDLIVVLVYLAGVTLVGCMMSRRTKTAAEFITAGGSLPGWVVGLSIIGTFVSSISFVANPGHTYSGTWIPFVFSLSLPYAALIATVYFVPFFRNCGSVSAYEHLENRFGAWSRIYSALFNVMYHLGRIGTILWGVSLAVSALIDVPISVIIVALGVLVIVYTLLGGIEAVIWTDVVQSIILIGGMLLCLFVLLDRVPGGFFGVIDGAHTDTENKLSLGSMQLTFASKTFWTTLLFGFFINLQNFAADQTYVQRYFTARSEHEARRSVWMGAIAYIPISAILFFIGTGLFVFYQSTGSLPPGTDPDRVLPYFIISELPTGLAGLLIAAILAAAMSTVDSSLNSSATLLLCDVWRRFLNPLEIAHDGTPIKNDHADLRFLRLMTLTLGVVGIAVALVLAQTEGMLKVWWTISGVLSGGTLGLLILARFTSAVGTRGAATGVVLGVLSITAISVAHIEKPASWLKPVCDALSPVTGWFHPLMAIVVGTSVVFVVGALFSKHEAGRSN